MIQQNDPKTLSMVVFIDALGWEVLKGRKFMEEELPHRRKLRSTFGFSSACLPSILTGKQPRDHGHWSYFYYSPKQSPFRPLRWLNILPRKLADRGRVRNAISKLVKRFYGFTGYFQLYNMPFDKIGSFDYCEKQDIFAPGGMNQGESIIDLLAASDRPYHVSDWRQGEEENLAAAARDIDRGEIEFAFLYMASMDGLLHQVGKESEQVDEKLAWYEEQLRALLGKAREQYDDVRLFICSDHGMATVNGSIDLMSRIEALGLRFGKDYAATYDSTMGRFWFKNDTARARIVEVLKATPEGRILSDAELSALGCDFEGSSTGN